MTAPDLYAGKLRGYRFFRPSWPATVGEPKAGPLKAQTGDYTWQPGNALNHAVCAHDMAGHGYMGGPHGEHPHGAPALDCRCGFYAWYDPQMADPFQFSSPRVFGVIEAGGRIVMHRHGFRAAQARIIAIGLPPADGIDVWGGWGQDRLTEAHKILAEHWPVYSDIDQMLSDYPPLSDADIDALIPERNNKEDD